MQEDAGVINERGSYCEPLALGVLAGLLIFFGVPFKNCAAERAHWLGSAWLFWVPPALLLALSARYQPGGHYLAVGYIPAAASSIGFTLFRGAAGAAGEAVL